VPGFISKKAPWAPLLAAILLTLSTAHAAGSKNTQDDSDVVSLDEPAPSATPSMIPTQAPTPVPTAAPTQVPTQAPMAPPPTAEPSPVVTASAKNDLSEPGFDKVKNKDLGGNEDDGLVIIAPGASSPEDSLEAFGIDSPFNWREKKKRAMLQPGEAGGQEGNESIELNAPETSDLKDRVSVEAPDQPASEAEDYDAVEKAGFILPSEDFRFDATVIREKNGRPLFSKGDLVYLQMEPGRQVYPGSIYSVFRDDGKVDSSGDEKRELGDLVRAVCVVRVIRVDSENIMARVERQYDVGNVGDGLRLRDPDRAKHFASLRQNAGETPASDLKGQVAELENRKLTIKPGQHAYLDIGRSQGVLTGMKLSIYRDVPKELDTTQILPGPVGKIGEFVVVSTQKNSCTVRLVKADTSLRVGDGVRYR
jgi:hypothetical protein